MLVALYEAMDGPNWERSANWLTDAPLGEWYGVTVREDGRVIGLHLELNRLKGTIPPELGNLTRLENLNLQNNDLTGAIPPELGDLVSLEWLSLSENYSLSGTIPPELGNLASLERLQLHFNALTGSIPPELGRLDKLTLFWLNDNDLSGQIPPELAGLVNVVDLDLRSNKGLCVPADPRLRAWLIARRAYPYICRPGPDVHLLPRALMRVDGNGMSLRLDSRFWSGSGTAYVSDPGVVTAATTYDDAGEWLELAPVGVGRTDVELVSDDSTRSVASVWVRGGVGTFGIDMVLEQPVLLGYEEALVEAADWWSSVLDGTEWDDRQAGHGHCYAVHDARALADELLISAGVTSFPYQSSHASARVQTCFWQDEYGVMHPDGGGIQVNRRFSAAGDVDVMRHEIGHILGLVGITGMVTEDSTTTSGWGYFTGPRAVEAYRAGGGDASLPGVPLPAGFGHHWGAFGELMSPYGGSADGLSLAALADLGYTVDMSKATPWQKDGATAVAATSLHEHIQVRISGTP